MIYQRVGSFYPFNVMQCGRFKILVLFKFHHLLPVSMIIHQDHHKDISIKRKQFSALEITTLITLKMINVRIITLYRTNIINISGRHCMTADRPAHRRTRNKRSNAQVSTNIFLIRKLIDKTFSVMFLFQYD